MASIINMLILTTIYGVINPFTTDPIKALHFAILVSPIILN